MSSKSENKPKKTKLLWLEFFETAIVYAIAVTMAMTIGSRDHLNLLIAIGGFLFALYAILVIIVWGWRLLRYIIRKPWGESNESPVNTGTWEGNIDFHGGKDMQVYVVGSGKKYTADITVPPRLTLHAEDEKTSGKKTLANKLERHKQIYERREL